MTSALLSPAALGALLAIAAPLVIHLARRAETRTIDFAALRWLTPNPRPVRRLHLDERLLLAVRIALITAIVVTLAQPVARPSGDGRPIVAVSPAVDVADVPDQGQHRVWLAPGFPGLDQPAPRRAESVASLARQLDAETPAGTPITLIVPPDIEGVDAQRLFLSRKVEWRIARAARPTSPAPAGSPPRLVVRYSPTHEAEAGYFRAAAVAYAGPGKAPVFDAASVEQAIPAGPAYLIWLSDAPLSAQALDWIESGGVALLASGTPSPVEGPQRVVWRQAHGPGLATAGRFGAGRVVALTQPLAAETLPELLEPDFPDRLWALLTDPPAPGRVAASDYAPSWITSGSIARYNPHPVDLRPWLALLICGLFGGERWLATRRRRAVAA